MLRFLNRIFGHVGQPKEMVTAKVVEIKESPNPTEPSVYSIWYTFESEDGRRGRLWWLADVAYRGSWVTSSGVDLRSLGVGSLVGVLRKKNKYIKKNMKVCGLVPLEPCCNG